MSIISQTRYRSAIGNSIDKPRRDEIRVGDKVKGGLLSSWSKLRRRYQSSSATESETFTGCYDDDDDDAAGS